MTAAIRDSLAQVQELLGRATPGPWECGAGKAYEPQTTVYCDDAAGSAVATCAHSMTVLIPVEQERANAAAIAAAVNWLRNHGPELMKMLEDRSAELTTAWMAGAESVRERNAEDAARYRWLRLHVTDRFMRNNEHEPCLLLPHNVDYLSPDEIDAAIDAVRAGERG